jgi:UDP-N-acetylmuramate dehydrogenase
MNGSVSPYAPQSWDPPVDDAALEAVVVRCRGAGLAVERDRAIGSATTLGVGGRANAYLMLTDLPAVRGFSRALAGSTAAQVPVFVLGKGSNTLVSDEGFAGFVVRLGEGHKWLRREGHEMSAGAGEAMPALAAWAAQEGLTGLEFAAGIPATVGGSVRMNAGAHGSDTATRLTRVDLVVAGEGDVISRPAAALGFAYRRSSLPERSVVVAAHWQLAPDDPEAIRHRLDELRSWRRATQPLRERNCGSVFTNPEGSSAGAVVEEAGGKGMRIGGAAVSGKHANFITVTPGAKAADVCALITAVRERVVSRGGPLLEPEIRLIGRFPVR